jgi:hypothetical protein
MRYSVRTLLILIAVLGLLFARIAHVRRMAAFHRGEVTRRVQKLATMVSLTMDSGDPKDFLPCVVDYAKYDSDYEVNPWYNPWDVEEDGHPVAEEWKAAVYHQAMANLYERWIYLFRPVPRITIVAASSPKAELKREKAKIVYRRTDYFPNYALRFGAQPTLKQQAQ